MVFLFLFMPWISFFFLSHLLHLYDSLVVAILFLVTIVLFHRVYNLYSFFRIFNSQSLEFTWTLIPGVLVLSCSIPGCYWIYFIETVSSRAVNLVIRNQWYWSYGSTGKTYDSIYYQGNLTSGNYLSNLYATRYWAITSNDVIHNFGVSRARDNALRVKMDAYPGRINISSFDVARPQGLYLRYCSELCGAQHAYMPISTIIGS